MGFWVLGSGLLFRVCGVELTVLGLGFRVQDPELWQREELYDLAEPVVGRGYFSET